MNRAVRPHVHGDAEIVDFDTALLDSCSPEIRAELIAEATLLAQAFAPEGRREELESMAAALTSGSRDGDMDRPRARKLAAALRHLANQAQD